MQNITLSANSRLIKLVRKKALAKQRVQEYRKLMDKLSDISTNGRKFSRDEMNERR